MMRARLSKSISGWADARRSSARFFAASARATSISSARSAFCARMVTRSGCTSAKPPAMQVGQIGPWRYQSSPVPSSASSGVCPREHTEVAFGAGDLDFLDGLVDQRAIGRDDSAA